ncbi:hypothetical protein ILUMI_22441 [Ignelater luminosus]|uniref:LITAF domain-containing protein n=1 Tax=Ignelater luminosus TaxID=2038154 RepID=A0A8K0CAN3_IGNLU|nr:hypothetical protein ILUMI_22441 [Ignelater luminosus]
MIRSPQYLSDSNYQQLTYDIPLRDHQGFATVVVRTTPQIALAYGPHPQPTTCLYCHKQITTTVVNDPTVRTHQMAFLLCIFCCMPCIPYCMNSCQNRNHYCPNCDAFLGTYSDGPGRPGQL